MQTTVLRYVLEIARCGSIRRAADALNIAASALSRHVAALEHEYGTPLFERHARGLRLTEAGEVFAAGARRTLQEADRIRDGIDDLRGLKRGTVRLHVVEGVVKPLLLPVLAEIGRRHPGIASEITVTGTEDILAALAAETTDIGLAFNPDPLPEVAVLRQSDHPVHVFIAPGHALAGRASVCLRDLSGLALGLPDASFGVRRLFDRTAARLGLSLEPNLTINSIEMAKAYAAAGMGLTVLPAFAALEECADGRLVAVPIGDDGLSHATLALCVRRGRRLSAAADHVAAAIAASAAW